MSNLLPPQLLEGTHRSYTMSHLWEGSRVDSTDPGERSLLNLVLPPWQRPVVWTQEQQVRFLEGVLLGLGAGFYVINGREWDSEGKNLPMSGWLLDGQQRITSISRFINDEISVFGGVRYSDLSTGERRRRFDNIVFPAIQIDYQPDESVLKELYRRLNFGGTAHTEADLALLDR